MTRITIVIARAQNGVIGRDGGLPWRLAPDLRRFKALTLGKPVLMGRRTWDSLGRALPGRRNLVLTRDPAWSAAGAERVDSLDTALRLADAPELMVIGGAQLCAIALPRADRFELTQIHSAPDGDTVMPAPEPRAWRETWREEHMAENGHPAFAFVTLERR
jgi:dihydrofolate reductase